MNYANLLWPSCHRIPILGVICLGGWGLCPECATLPGKTYCAITCVPLMILGLNGQTHTDTETAPLWAQWEMWAVRKFKATISSDWEKLKPLVLNLFSFLKVESGVTFAVKPSPKQSPLTESISPSPLLLELFLLHGLGLVCRVHSLHLSFWPQTLSYSSWYPSLASTKQLLNLLRSTEFSLATWIESTFTMYLDASQKESLDPVKSGWRAR